MPKKIEMIMSKHFNAKDQWPEDKLSINKEFLDEDEVIFKIYANGDNKLLAIVTTFFNPTMIVGEIVRINIYNKETTPLEVLKEVVSYIYMEQNIFRVLVLRISISESGFDDLDLQCSGFYTNNAFVWYHLNPNYQEIINNDANNEEIKTKLNIKMSGMCIKKDKYFAGIQNKLEYLKKDLEEMQLENDMRCADLVIRQIEIYEKILGVAKNNELAKLN